MKSKLFTVRFLIICFMIGLSVTAKGQYYDNYQYQLYQAQQQLLYQQYQYRQMLIQQQYQLNQQGQQLMQQATNPSTPNYNIDWDAWFENYSETNQSNSGQYQSTDYNSNSANQGQYQNSNSSRSEYVFKRNVQACKITEIDNRESSRSMVTLPVYSKGGREYVLVGGVYNLPSTSNGSTGYSYFTIVSRSYGCKDWYYFNL